jgi:hypothetical protein
MKHTNGASLRRHRPDEPLDRFVAGAVAVLLDQVLPDPLQTQADVELLGNRPPDRRRQIAAAPLSRGTSWPHRTDASRRSD